MIDLFVQMGHCISDSTTNDERFKTEKVYDIDGVEPEFCQKKMNENVKP